MKADKQPDDQRGQHGEEAHRQVKELVACLRELSSRASAWEPTTTTRAELRRTVENLEAIAEAQGPEAVLERLSLATRFENVDAAPGPEKVPPGRAGQEGRNQRAKSRGR